MVYSLNTRYTAPHEHLLTCLVRDWLESLYGTAGVAMLINYNKLYLSTTTPSSNKTLIIHQSDSYVTKHLQQLPVISDCMRDSDYKAHISNMCNIHMIVTTFQRVRWSRSCSTSRFGLSHVSFALSHLLMSTHSPGLLQFYHLLPLPGHWNQPPGHPLWDTEDHLYKYHKIFPRDTLISYLLLAQPERVQCCDIRAWEADDWLVYQLFMVLGRYSLEL